VDDLLSEKEQIDQLKQWWKENGGYVIGGLALGIAILFGFNYYENSKLEAQLGGSELYETLTGHVVEGRLEAAEETAAELTTDYADTTYAAQARLAMARLYMDRNRDQDAAVALREILDSEADTAVQHVARTRLARVLEYQGDAQGVVDLLEGQESPAFTATWSELLGNAYHELGRIEDATAAYQTALLDPMAQATVDRELLQWKMLDLPAAEAAPVTDEPAVEPAAEPEVEAGEDEGTE